MIIKSSNDDQLQQKKKHPKDDVKKECAKCFFFFSFFFPSNFSYSKASQSESIGLLCVCMCVFCCSLAVVEYLCSKLFPFEKITQIILSNAMWTAHTFKHKMYVTLCTHCVYIINTNKINYDPFIVFIGYLERKEEKKNTEEVIFSFVPMTE